jgi:hypothetical protein
VGSDVYRKALWDSSHQELDWPHEGLLKFVYIKGNGKLVRLPHLFVYYYYFCGAWDQTLSLAHAMQMLYH